MTAIPDSLANDMGDQRNAEQQRRHVPAPRTREQPRVDGRLFQGPTLKERFWPGTLMAFGVIAALITFWGGVFMIYISITDLLRWFALFAFAGNVLPYKRTGLRFGMARLEWFLFNVLAIGPFLFALFVWLNVFVHGPKELFHVKGRASDPVRYWRDTGEMPPTEAWESVRGKYAKGDIEQFIRLDMVLAKAHGCLGYDVRTGVSVEELQVP
jgi:hypothetical protein